MYYSVWLRAHHLWRPRTGRHISHPVTPFAHTPARVFTPCSTGEKCDQEEDDVCDEQPHRLSGTIVG